jgi:hypothetical protein
LLGGGRVKGNTNLHERNTNLHEEEERINWRGL